MIDASSKKDVIIYDGDCRFCRQAIAAIHRRDKRDQFEYVPRQTPGIEQRFPQLIDGDFEAGMRLVESGGNTHIGADAFYRIMLRLPYFRWFSWMYRIPMLNKVIRWVYSWIAAHRLQLSRYCGDECKLDGEAAGAIDDPRAVLSKYQIVISIVILLILGLHGLATSAKVMGLSSWLGDRSWPFLAYGMYRQSYRPSAIRASKERIFALTSAGQEIELGPGTVGLHAWALRRHYLRPIRVGDKTAARSLAERINLGRSDPVVGLRFDSETYAISDAGVVSESTQSVTYPIGN